MSSSTIDNFFENYIFFEKTFEIGQFLKKIEKNVNFESIFENIVISKKV